MPIIKVPTQRIIDWPTFHDVFADVLGFFEGYGRNQDAWVDCVSSADLPEDELMGVTVGEGDILTLELEDVEAFSERCPDQYAALIEMSAFVNWSRADVGLRPIIALSFHK